MYHIVSLDCILFQNTVCCCTKLHKPKFLSFLNLNHEKHFEEYSGRKLEEEEEEEEKKELASNNFPAFLQTEQLYQSPLFPHWASIISAKYSNILKLKVLKILFNCIVADTPGH